MELKVILKDMDTLPILVTLQQVIASAWISEEMGAGWLWSLEPVEIALALIKCYKNSLSIISTCWS